MNRHPDRVSLPRIADDVVIRDPVPFADPDFTNGNPTLSPSEADFFKENGFIVKRGLLDDRENFARIVDYFWENVPRGLVRRDDTETWYGDLRENWTEEDEARYGQMLTGAWKMRSRDVIGREDFILDKVGNHPRMRRVASRFVGEPLKATERVRGIYAVFPVPPGSEGKLSPHADHTAAQLSAMVIVDEIPPRCGGFTVWPGSHVRAHPYAVTIHGPINQDTAEDYARARDQILRDITPVELWGSPGDVIFWHGRLVHSGGINRSAERDHPVLRLIIPCDYQRDGFTFYDDLVEGPGPNHQWWIDTRNFREDPVPTPDNIWDNWAFTTD